MTFPILTRQQVVDHLTNEFGEPLVLTPMLRGLLGAIDDPRYLEYLLRVVRQVGKSTGLASVADTELLCAANSYTVLVAASQKQQQAIYERKVRRPLERLLKGLGLRGLAQFTKQGVEIPDLNSALEVVASVEDTTPGRTVTKLLIDEARYVADEVYTALAPSVIGAGGKVVIASSSGPPRGFFHALVTQPTEHTWLHESAENDNPRANKGVLDFIKRRIGLVSPAAARRELGNEFAADEDELIAAALIDAAIDDRLGEMPAHEAPAYAFLDLGRKRDLSSLVTVVREASRQLEARDHLVAASILTWSPKQSPTGEVDFREVRAALDRLPRRFPSLVKVLVDEGAEAGSVLPWMREHPLLAARVEGFTGSVGSNMDIWGSLLARLNGQTLSIPRHERLLSELRNVRKEEFAYGSKWRVVDASRKFHRDVSLALAGACFAAEQAAQRKSVPLDILMPSGQWALKDSPTADEQFAELVRLARVHGIDVAAIEAEVRAEYEQH